MTFDLDANSILHITAVDKKTNISNSIRITNDQGRLTRDEIDEMIKSAEQFKTEDEVTPETHKLLPMRMMDDTVWCFLKK